ncbi:hypothetical protein [Ferruginibacter albus]|uniref:hypothetical protein n=1 Tax=Ferruginibacter albus TaxID=2875540 RepID=UPI001CC4735C|nr:hypothetical protein [Ferruginibacter albus]UAY52019.1 hypothetical protein K9M53_15675 [Ferruginibacter albus]
MSTSEYSVPGSENQPSQQKGKNVIIGILTAALILVGGYLIVDKNRSGETIQTQQSQIAKVTDEKSDLQKSFDASLVRLDSMTNFSNTLQTKLAESNQEIDKTKAEIRSILNKKNATAAELNKAKSLIADLNGKITDMQNQIAQLTQDNQMLTQDKATLTQAKDKLTQDLATSDSSNKALSNKVDVASTLNASNISITPVKIKGSGKEKVTTTAKRVDKMVISFDVDNRIAQTGATDVYVCVIGPDGKPVIQDSSAASTFTTREEGDKPYSAKVTVDIETAKKKNVEFAFKPSSQFQEGSYTIQIYQNGFKIGEGTKELKKGGIFG